MGDLGLRFAHSLSLLDLAVEIIDIVLVVQQAVEAVDLILKQDHIFSHGMAQAVHIHS